MMTKAFDQPRTISSAAGIPFLGGDRRINLVRTNNAPEAALRRAGAEGSAHRGWVIARDAVVDLAALDAYLPHYARQTITPNVVDLIPESSWCASLANMLTPKSWSLVRDVAVFRANGCEDCGDRDDLECHELWSYDEDQGVQTLTGLRSLCRRCHETQHLGLATVRGRYAATLDRLVRINRIQPDEIPAYTDAIITKFERRSEIEWSLDLTMLAGQQLTLKRTFEEVAPNTVVGDSRSGEIEVTLLGVAIYEPARGGSGLTIA